MRIFLAMLAAVASTCPALAEYRSWTHAETGRTITAEMVDRSHGPLRARLKLSSGGRATWVNASDLSAKDQAYIAKWIPPIDHLTVRVIGSQRRNNSTVKRLSVTARARNERVIVSGAARFAVEPGCSKTVIVTSGPKYEVSVHSASGKLLDVEKWNRKTGL